MKVDLLAAVRVRAPHFLQDRLVMFTEPRDDLPPPRRGTVDLSQVQGVWHPDYGNLTWGELFGLPGRTGRRKRLDSCLQELRSNPAYYLSRQAKFDWSFFEVEGKYFCATGHHRTVVGRIVLELNGLKPLVHGVSITAVRPLVWQAAQSAPEPTMENLASAWDGALCTEGEDRP